MDNFKIDVVSESKEDFVAALGIAMRQQQHEATHFKVAQVKADMIDSNKEDLGMALILYWAEPTNDKDATRLPFKLTESNAAEFCWSWLKSQNIKDYANYIDMDGTCSPTGFRIFNQSWGHINGQWEAFVAIQPSYAWFGK